MAKATLWKGWGIVFCASPRRRSENLLAGYETRESAEAMVLTYGQAAPAVVRIVARLTPVRRQSRRRERKGR